jgi:diguanylate cyclase (GGDEF)-like protein
LTPRRRPRGPETAPPRLVLRFAISTGIALALAAAAILMIVRHYDTVQAERAATAHVRVLASTSLRGPLVASDFEPGVTAERRDALDRLFATRVLEQGFVRATLLAHDGTVTYSTDHRLVGTRGGDREHIGEALAGTIRGDVMSLQSDGGTLKALRTYAPVAVPGGTGVMVLHQDYGPIARAANAAFLPVAGIFEAVLLLLFVALAPILRRVTQRIRRQMDEIEHRAHYDELTGLPNRTLYRSLVERAVNGGAPAAVLLLDVDRFKEVNDALGHERGDLLLQELGARLHRVCEGEVVARLGGDEFAILLAGSAEEASALAARIHAALEEPFDLNGFALEIAASIGVAASPEHGADVDTLVQHADVAMYVAKGAHAGTSTYDPEQDTNDAARLALAGELRRALDDDELVVHYQPKADLGTGEISGVEALVRWEHPSRGFIPPDEFIPIAERTGLIKTLSRYVLAAALRERSRWAAAGHDLHVAVNLTIPDLLDQDLPDRIAALLDETGVSPDDLELEITESTILADPLRVRQNLDRLNELGLSLAIDDFGTGYSSLAYLKRLPVSTIKIDRSFVMDMLESDSDAAIVRSTIELGRNLGLRVVAEGVETEEAWNALREHGCTLAQGYLIGKPMPAEELGALLEAQPRARRRRRLARAS